MLNNFRNDTAEKIFTKERKNFNSVCENKSKIVDKIIWGHEVAVWNKIYKTDRASKLYRLMKDYRNVIYFDDQMFNVGYVALVPGKVNAVMNDIAIYYHKKMRELRQLNIQRDNLMTFKLGLHFTMINERILIYPKK